MKKIIFLLLLSFVFFSCGEKKNNTPETDKTKSNNSLTMVKDNTPPGNISLNYQLKKGQHIAYQLVNKSSTSRTVIADSTNTQKAEQNVTYKIDMDVLDVDNNVMDIKINISSIKADINMDGQKLSYQSGNNLDESTKMRFADFETLVNTPFNISLASDGEINEFYKVDKVINKFLNFRRVPKDSITENMKKQVQFNIVEGALRPLLSQIFRKLPDKKLSLDSSWTNIYSSQLPPFEMKNTAKFKLIDFQKLENDRLAVIDAGLQTTSKGKNKFTNRGINYNVKNPESTGNGKIYFNLSKGLLQQSNTNTSIKITTDISAPTSPRGPIKAKTIDQTENTYSVQLL